MKKTKEMNPLTEKYIEFLRETPKSSGRPYSQSYIHSIKYQVNRLKEPITLESLNDFIRKNELHPSTARSLHMFYIWYKYGRLDKETRKRAVRELDKQDKFFYVPPSKPKKYTKWEKDLTKEEKEKLIKESPYPWNMILRLMFDTMLRKAELLSVDIDKNLNLKENYIIVSSIKGGDSDVRFFWSSTKEAIMEYMKKEKITSGKLLQKFSPYTFWYRFNANAVKVIGKKFNPHWVRNTENQLMRDAGKDKSMRKERGGWKTDAMVDNVYSGSSLASKKKAFEEGSIEVK